MRQDHTPVMINLLATARYDRMPEVPIQFITVEKLFYRGPRDAQICYVESQQDEETGEVLNSDICLTFAGDKVTIQRNGLRAFTVHRTGKWIWQSSQRKRTAGSGTGTAPFT